MENGGRQHCQKTTTCEAKQNTTPPATNRGEDRRREEQTKNDGGMGWARGAPQGGGGGATIFLFCVVKLGWIPPARPPFTEPLEEILLLVPAVLRPYSATFR